MSVAPLPGIQPIIMSRPQIGIERLPSRRMGNEPREAMNCKSCRKRKIKCNRLRPSCEACQVFQCPCVYDAIPKKRGPKTDVLEALLKRVDGLEAQLKDRRQSDASPTTEHIVVEETLGSVAAEQASEPKSKRPTIDNVRTTEIAAESAIYSPTFTNEPPTPNIQIDALLDTYFSRFHAKPYHIIDESSVRQRLQLNQLPSYLMQAIYAVAARYTAYPTGYQSAVKMSEEYALRSRNEIDTDEPSIDALQALLLLVTAFTAAGKGKKAYMLLTTAIGMAMALELHREVDLHSRITTVEREIRRRLFWTCYLLDKFMACGSKRPCIISDRTILLRLPCWSPGPTSLPVEGDFFQNGSNLQHIQGSGRKSQGSSGMLIDISRILGTTNRYLAAGGVKGDSHFPWHALSELSKIRHDLDIWTSGTDDVFSSVDTLFGQPDSTVLVLSKLVYHLIHCLIYRPFLPINLAELAGTSQHQSWQIEATNICFLHANAIAELVELGKQMASIEWPAFVGYCICTAGTVHIHGAHYTKNGGENMGVFSSSSEFLSRELHQLGELSYTWASVLPQRDTLENIYNAHAELIKGLANNSMRYPPTLALEDFFDRYSNIGRPGGLPFTFDAANLRLSDAAFEFASDSYNEPDMYASRIYTDSARSHIKRKIASRRRSELRGLTPVNTTHNGPLSSGLPTPTAQSRHFSFSATQSPPSALQGSNTFSSHGASAAQIAQQKRGSMDDQANAVAAAAGFDSVSEHQSQQMHNINAAPFSPSYHYATPSPSGDNESSLGVANYDPMFGTVPTNTFSSPTPWHNTNVGLGIGVNGSGNGGVDDRKNHAPSPGAGSTGTSGNGEEKDPFLSLLEQLAENEHAIGQGKEIDFFLAGAQP